MKTPCWCPSGWALLNIAAEPKETSITEFCYKSVNLPLEELKNVKIFMDRSDILGYCPQARKIGVPFQTTTSEKWED